MSYRPTGDGLPDDGLSAAKTESSVDNEVARGVVNLFLEERLLLSEHRPSDELACVESAIKCRAFLTEQLMTIQPGTTLEDSLRGMRAALRTFVDAAGPNVRNFRGHLDAPSSNPYGRAWEALRQLLSLHLASVAKEYDLQLDSGLNKTLHGDSVDPHR